MRQVLAVVGLVVGLVSASLAATDDRPVSGLIVKLKEPSGSASGSKATQNARSERLARLARAAGYTSVMPWRAMGGSAVVLTVPTPLRPEMVQRVIAQLKATGEVAWVEPNVRERLMAVTPNDAYYGGQWWLKAATTGNTAVKPARQRGAPGFETAWNTTTGGTPGTVIAVLDTGILPHPDLPEDRILPGYDFVSESPQDNDDQPGRDSNAADPGDWVTQKDVNSVVDENGLPIYKLCDVQNSTWHGTVIAGMLAARTNNRLGSVDGGVAAMNWTARILPVRVAGKCGAKLEDIADAIRWAAGINVNGVPRNATPAKIINISFGGSSPCGPVYQSAINDARARGAVVVVAAGNEHGVVSRPANCANVIAVAGLNREGFKSTYSNFGANVDIATVSGDPGPGEGYTDAGRWGSQLGDEALLTIGNSGTTKPDVHDYFGHGGTSFAAPIVAGVISLMLDISPNLTPDQIEMGLRRTVRPHVTSNLMAVCSNANPGRCICTTATCGAGILDAAEAVRFAREGGTYVAPRRLAENIDSSDVVEALAFSPSDRDANVSVAATKSAGGGGGGAFDVLSLAGLASLLVALLAGARQKALARG